MWGCVRLTAEPWRADLSGEEESEAAGRAGVRLTSLLSTLFHNII